MISLSRLKEMVEEEMENKIKDLELALKAKEQECERLKEAIKTKTGKDYINEIQDITMKYECHQKSMGVCWWGKYGKETKCIGIRECHKRELEVIQKLETTLDQLKEQLEAYKMEADEGKEINAGLQAENESLENQLKSEKERFEKQDKYAAMYIQELKNEQSSLIKNFLEKIGQLQSENEELKKQLAELISQSALLPKFFGLSAEEITQLTTKCSKLSKTLTEIEEIARGEYCKFIDNDEIVLKILQKISEVEDEKV